MSPLDLIEIMRCPEHLAALYSPLLAEYMPAFRIDTPLRKSAFLATIGHESQGLRYTAEVWGPTEAQKRYEGRTDLGNTYPGDGYRFRGRALIQITGHNNYIEVTHALGIDYVNNPDWLARPEDATRASCWWFESHGCLPWADKGEFLAVSNIVNRGTPHTTKLPNGWPDRQARYNRARRILMWSDVIAGSKTTAPPP